MKPNKLYFANTTADRLNLETFLAILEIGDTDVAAEFMYNNDIERYGERLIDEFPEYRTDLRMISDYLHFKYYD